MLSVAWVVCCRGSLPLVRHDVHQQHMGAQTNKQGPSAHQVKTLNTSS